VKEWWNFLSATHWKCRSFICSLVNRVFFGTHQKWKSSLNQLIENLRPPKDEKRVLLTLGGYSLGRIIFSSLKCTFEFVPAELTLEFTSSPILSYKKRQHRTMYILQSYDRKIFLFPGIRSRSINDDTTKLYFEKLNRNTVGRH
jgi:hypothetical protein